MTTLTWETSTDWDNAQSDTGVVHESVSNTDHNDATVVKKGFEIASPTPSDNLLGYWPLHEDSGSTAYDFSGNGFDGTYNGPTLGQTGLLGTTAPDFDGTDDYIDCGGAGHFDVGSNVTCGCWVNLDDNSSLQSVMGKFGNDNDSYLLQLFDSDSDSTVEVNWNIEINDGNFNVRPSDDIPSSQWTHIVGTYDGSQLAVYIDGSQVGTTSQSGSIDNSSSNLIIGSQTGGTKNYTDGAVADARVYDDALSSSEVQTWYDSVNTSGTLTTAAKTS